MIENIDGVNVKYCPRCEETLPVEMFGKHKGQSDGLQPCCKPCRRIYANEYRKINCEYLKQYHFEWRDKNREHVNQLFRKYYQDNYDNYRKAIFRSYINNAIKAGTIVKPTECTLCGATERIQSHHLSYEPGHEFDIIWVCSLCHASIHIQLRREQEESE